MKGSKALPISVKTLIFGKLQVETPIVSLHSRARRFVAILLVTRRRLSAHSEAAVVGRSMAKLIDK